MNTPTVGVGDLRQNPHPGVLNEVGRLSLQYFVPVGPSGKIWPACNLHAGALGVLWPLQGVALVARATSAVLDL